MCCGSVRSLWASQSLSLELPISQRGEGLFLPVTLPFRVPSAYPRTCKARKSGLFEAPLCFRNHPFHLMMSSAVLRWTQHPVSWKRSQETAETSFCQYCNQESKFLFFRGQVIHSNASGSSLSSVAAYAVSPASVTHRALPINTVKPSVSCWSCISTSS